MNGVWDNRRPGQGLGETSSIIHTLPFSLHTKTNPGEMASQVQICFFGSVVLVKFNFYVLEMFSMYVFFYLLILGMIYHKLNMGVSYNSKFTRLEITLDAEQVGQKPWEGVRSLKSWQLVHLNGPWVIGLNLHTIKITSCEHFVPI